MDSSSVYRRGRQKIRAGIRVTVWAEVRVQETNLWTHIHNQTNSL